MVGRNEEHPIATDSEGVFCTGWRSKAQEEPADPRFTWNKWPLSESSAGCSFLSSRTLSRLKTGKFEYRQYVSRGQKRPMKAGRPRS